MQIGNIVCDEQLKWAFWIRQCNVKMKCIGRKCYDSKMRDENIKLASFW